MDFVIPVSPKDVFTLGKSLKYINQNFSHPNIYIITKKNCFRYFYSFKKYAIICIDEDDLFNGLTFDNVKKCIENHQLIGQRVGWWFQQFLKMAFSYSPYAKEYYVVWDADTIPLNPIDFIDNKSGAFLFNLKEENYHPYFVCMDKILGLKKQIEMSFITEHMVISTEIMRRLTNEIESFSKEEGNWWQKIIKAQPTKGLAGFSEFETYGTYMMVHYPNLVKFRSLNTDREGREKYGLCVTRSDLHNASKHFDTISFERRVDTKPHPICRKIREWGFMQYCRILRKYYHIS